MGCYFSFSSLFNEMGFSSSQIYKVNLLVKINV